MIATVTSKGQITIPVGVRRAAGLDAGTQVEFIVNARRRIELVPRQGDIRALRGSVPPPTAAVGVDAMTAAATRAWAGAASGSGSGAQVGEGAQAPSPYRVRLSPAGPAGKT